MSDHSALILLGCALITVIAALVAATAGYLARRDGATYPTAIVRAAVAFTASITLATVVATVLRGWA